MPLPNRPSVHESTKKSYLRRTRDLLRQCRRELEIPLHTLLDYRQLVGWLVTKKPEWSRPTWRQYKASVLYFLNEEAAGDEPQVQGMAQEAAQTLEREEVEGCIVKAQRTSAAKKKRFPLSDYHALVQNMRATRSRWSEDTSRWISATLLTGLRPTEWRDAAVVTVSTEGQSVRALRVRNAKNSNQRAHGTYRHILLDGLNTDEVAIIQAHVERAHVWEAAGRYSELQKGCSAALAQAHKRLWPKRTEHATLYSVRHQFAADAKASGMSREEIAALMGHATNETATLHYGRKTAGVSMVRVRAHPDEWARIRQVYQERPPAPEPRPKAAPTVKAAPRLVPPGADSDRG